MHNAARGKLGALAGGFGRFLQVVASARTSPNSAPQLLDAATSSSGQRWAEIQLPKRVVCIRRCALGGDLKWRALDHPSLPQHLACGSFE
eukprot:2972626-Alexandrium_andersonii.AAC.1